MRPIVFECSAEISLTPDAICDNIADMTRWPDFDGYLMMPGIDSASYDTRTPNMVGSRIRVKNSDGSQHIETITAWKHGVTVAMKLHRFGPPLANIASHFDEVWTFDRLSLDRTRVKRYFALHPKSRWTRPALWLISQLFRRAIAHHLRIMQTTSPAAPHHAS